LTDHGGSTGVNLQKNPIVEGLQTYLRWRVINQERRTSRSGDPLFCGALLGQEGLYCSGEEIF
jgi:hypothetical protein